MNLLIALASRIIPGLLKTLANDPDGNVKEAVIDAVTTAIGAANSAAAEETLRNDPTLRAQLESSIDLQEKLAEIALEQEKARLTAQTDQMKLQHETAIRLEEQSSAITSKLATLDVESQENARAQQLALVDARNPIAWAPALLSAVVTVGFFLIFFAFLLLKGNLEAPSMPRIPEGQEWALLSDDQKAALLRPPSDFVVQIINILVGTLAAGFSTVLSYWLGSSLGSRSKDRQIAAATVAAESATEVASKAKDALNTSERARSTAELERDKVMMAFAPPEVQEVLGAKGQAQLSPAAVRGMAAVTAAPSLLAEEGRASAAPPPISHGVLEAELTNLVKPHRQFPGSVTWALTLQGISVDGGPAERTGGTPDTVTRIWRDFGPLCAEAARTNGVPVELIIATIATESAGKPGARREEPRRGDVSVGLMQTLVTTASTELGRRLTASDLTDPKTSIAAGTLYIANRRRVTHFDPPLVAASYNAGGLYREDAEGNRWRLRCHPKGTGRHLETFTSWFGDAMRVSAEADWSDGGRVPSFAHLLRGGGSGPASGAGVTPDGGAGLFPIRPDFDPVIDDGDRNEMFGKFDFEHDPLPSNREHIKILDDWVEKNIVDVSLPGPPGLDPIKTKFNRRGAKQLLALWEEWRDGGLLDRIVTYDGGFNPRFQRGSTRKLSNHAWGTAFDINAGQNGLNKEPARSGEHGCVYALVEAANRHGFFWGGHFRSRKDGMHFEIARLL